MTVYLAPDRPRWRPHSEQDIAELIAQGLLVETHYLDGKREIGSSSGDRKELARDLASFAIDGGALLIGVEERKEQRTWQLAPQPLAGLPERVEQIAGQLVDPPLFVQVTEIPSEQDPAFGYLFVEVPASASAPHMVENIYFGRGDRTRTRLSDTEVVWHHVRRESVEAQADRLLDAEIDRDPGGRAAHQCGRIYAVAHPLTAARDAGRRILALPQQQSMELVRRADAGLPGDLRQAAPALDYLSQFSRRSQGVAWSSHTVSGPGRTLRPYQDGEQPKDSTMLDVELRQDAGVRLLVGRLTELWGGRWQPSEDEWIIFDALFVAYGLRLAAWAAAVGEAVGYRGSWLFGVHGSDLRGLRSYKFTEDIGGWGGHRYDAEYYREVTTATHLELVQEPGRVAERLLGRLVHALGTEKVYSAAFGHGPE